jgi:translation initiation factor 5B
VKVGPVVKRDVMKASVMLEHEVKYAAILAFDVKIEKDAQDMADSLGVKIFQVPSFIFLFERSFFSFNKH